MRYRRIKKIEAELRKSQKHIARSEKYMTMWRAQTLDLKSTINHQQRWVNHYQNRLAYERAMLNWAKLPADYKGVRGAAETETHGAYRFRRCMTHGCTLVNVYITDMKTVEIPKK
ncbi:Uncharacterised protein [Klebsiella quasipneumoniae]|nr:Uncharacterised protein [Klebsiella quasipneumoniae]